MIVSLNNVLLERVCSYKYLNNEACILIFKTMVLSILEYGNIIYSGTTQTSLDTLDRLFYRGLRICDASNNNVNKIQLCHECKITPLDKRREIRL